MEQQTSRVRQALEPYRQLDHRKTPKLAFVAGTVNPALWLGIAIGLLAFFNVGVGVAFATITLASLQLRLGNMLHECGHSTFSSDKHVNDFFGEIFAVLTLNCFVVYKPEHGTHHLHLGDYSLDRDFKGLAALGYEKPVVSGWTIVRWFLGTLSPSQFVGTYLPKKVWWQIASAREKSIRVAYYLTLSLITMIWPIFGISWLIAMFIVAPMFKSWRDIVDHGGLYIDSPHGTQQTRNFIVVNPLLRWVLWPRNDCYHLTHHLAPYVPVEHLHAAHEKLKAALPEYAELPHYAVERLFTRAAQPAPQAGE